MNGFRDIGVAINIASFGHAVRSFVALDIGLAWMVWNGGIETSCFNSSFSFLFCTVSRVRVWDLSTPMPALYTICISQ